MSSSYDGVKIPMNIGDAIILKTIRENSEIAELQKMADLQNVEHFIFTREMLESSDDSLVDANHQKKSYQDIEKL